MATKGHWPAGKRRNTALPEGKVRLLMRRIGKLLPPPGRGANNGHYGPTKRSLAADIGVDEKTIARWLVGTDIPGDASLIKLQHWLDGQQKQKPPGREPRG